MKRALASGSILVFLTCAAGIVHAKDVTREAFRWSGKLAAGQTLHLRNLNGAVRVQAAAGDAVEIVANEQKRDGDTGQITVQQVSARDGLVFCVIYPGKPGRCDADGSYEGGGDHDQHISADEIFIADQIRQSILRKFVP